MERKGIRNPGLWCYAISGLQFLFTMPEFVEELKASNGPLAKEILGVYGTSLAGEFFNYCTTVGLGSNQESDAASFVAFLLQRLRKEGVQTEYLKVHVTSIPIGCECEKPDFDYNDLLIMSVPSEPTPMWQLMDQPVYEHYRCSKCPKAKKKITYGFVSQYLIVRFGHAFNTTNNVIFGDKSIDIKYAIPMAYILNRNNHYISYCRKDETTFYEFNDRIKTEISISNMLAAFNDTSISSKIMLVLYKKTNYKIPDVISGLNDLSSTFSQLPKVVTHYSKCKSVTSSAVTMEVTVHSWIMNS